MVHTASSPRHARVSGARPAASPRCCEAVGQNVGGVAPPAVNGQAILRGVESLKVTALRGVPGMPAAACRRQRAQVELVTAVVAIQMQGHARHARQAAHVDRAQLRQEQQFLIVCAGDDQRTHPDRFCMDS
jgi:hypothetical protein